MPPPDRRPGRRAGEERGARPPGGLRLGPGPEFELIRDFLAAAAAPSDAAVGAGDDAAVLRPPAGEALVLGTDLAVEDVHFRREWMTWESVGYRTVAAALSDLAAMAARPLGALLSVALPPELDREVALSLAAGAGACLRAAGTGLAGGDLSRSPGPVVLDAVAVGSAERPVLRSGLRPGDALWVTGALGAAAAAVADLSGGLEPDPRARRAFERPRPRLEEARWLAERAELSALIDLSDGLAGDAAHLAAASETGLEIELEALPMAEPLRGYARPEAARRLALGGGEDYELLVGASHDALAPLAAAFEARFGIELTRVGRVVDGEGVRWLGPDGRPVDAPAAAWDHFAGDR